jgi:hypothetical protein
MSTHRPALLAFAEREVSAGGWLAAQMRRDLELGFVGHLGRLAPDLVTDDDIFGRDRLSPTTRPKDLGALSDDAAWSEQFQWWNAETQGNWRDGWLRHALGVGDGAARADTRRWVAEVLHGQDADGYLGIHAPQLRYPMHGENGELWAQAVLLRALLGYVGHTDDRAVMEAIRRAVARTMRGYPPERSHPFGQGKSWAGVAHGLMFVDVLWQLALASGDEHYLRYAGWLYRVFATSPHAAGDAQVAALLDQSRPFGGHGVHTYEHWRALMIALHAGDGTGWLPYRELDAAYVAKLGRALTPSGAPNGDEFIHPLGSADDSGYEYCSTVELLDSYGLRTVLTGDTTLGDAIESLVFNVAMGARDPIEAGVAYLKTDNSYSMTGSQGPRSPASIIPQTRYMYSPLHRQAAVCCVPNAGRLLPTYLRYQWLRGSLESGQQVVALLYGPSLLRTHLNGVPVHVEQVTDYPARTAVALNVEPARPLEFVLSLRRPAWARDVRVTAPAELAVEGDERLIHLRGRWSGRTQVEVEFEAQPEVRPAGAGTALVGHGPLLYAEPLPGVRTTLTEYAVKGVAAPFRDVAIAPAGPPRAVRLEPGAQPQPARVPDDTDAADAMHEWQRMALKLPAHGAAGPEELVVVPMGATTLRRLTFPVRGG